MSEGEEVEANASAPVARRAEPALTVANLLLLLFAVASAATGQLMLKYGMTGVAEDLDAGELRGLVEDSAKRGAAAVVHEEDGGRAACGEVPDEIDQTGGGPVGGNEDDVLDGLFRLHSSRSQ